MLTVRCLPPQSLAEMKAAAGLLSRRFALRLLSCAPLAAPPVLRAFAAQSEQTPSEGFITPSGLRLFDFQTGEGPTPRWGQLIRLHYVGYTVSSTGGELEIFDSTYKRKDPYFTKHGNGQTVRGLEEAMHGMQAGGRRRVIIPAGQLSYITDKGPVPPGPQARNKMYNAVNDQQVRAHPSPSPTLPIPRAGGAAPPRHSTTPRLHAPGVRVRVDDQALA